MNVDMPSGTTWIVVIDTDSYAGKFERQIAGYSTGVCDVERRHGIEEAKEAELANRPMVDALRAKSTPVAHYDYGMVTNTIRATPGRLNNGWGHLYDANDPQAAEKARAKAKQSAVEYYAAHEKDVRRRLAEGDFQADGPGAWTKEACERTLENNRKSIERAGENIRNIAYQSVAMFFDEPLTADELAFVRSRAEEFAASPTPRILIPKPFRILDVHMIRAEVKAVETRVEPAR